MHVLYPVHFEHFIELHKSSGRLQWWGDVIVVMVGGDHCVSCQSPGHRISDGGQGDSPDHIYPPPSLGRYSGIHQANLTFNAYVTFLFWSLLKLYIFLFACSLWQEDIEIPEIKQIMKIVYFQNMILIAISNCTLS